MITCTANGKIYIGSAVNLQARRHTHFSKLKLGKHGNAHLQNAYNKYGIDAFRFEVLELVMPWNVLEREQYWFKKLKPFGNRGFNICPKANGCEHSPETRKKISDAAKERINLPGMRQKLSDSHKGKIPSPEARKRMSEARKGVKMSDECRLKHSLHWIATSPDGEEFEFVNLKGFSESRGLTAGSMCRVARGEYSNHKGWKCRYAE